MGKLIDSLSAGGNLWNLQDNHPSDSAIYLSAAGQAFTTPSIKYALTTCKFNLKKILSPTGNATGQLFACTGTVGSSGVPTGSALATSGNFDVSTLTTSYQLIEFTFSTPYEMVANTDYCIAFVNPSSGVDDANYPVIEANRYGDGSAHAGNAFTYLNSAWGAGANDEAVFYIYGTPVSIAASIQQQTQIDSLFPRPKVVAY